MCQHRIKGYRLIFSQRDTSIAFFQLLLNVGFAALLGAILATIVAKMSKRARWISTCIVAVAIASFVGSKIVQREWLLAEAEEQYAEASFVRPYGADEIVRARGHFRNAAFNWRVALQFEKAKSAEARANGAAEEIKVATFRCEQFIQRNRRPCLVSLYAVGAVLLARQKSF